ncbi:TadE/TadG family type IV pilus assembly protein [Massilia cavernae]|uniref:Pilus assembly protein n=1 Tax=Massilia cavernae TaxID=2320864 RepID=A0A418XXY4_9BURK|nr:TadE/TadG family type IV pilus assembly protein [Massilia cavernae]RJG17808.1 pilus assembly protein [Massilia cavernae]
MKPPAFIPIRRQRGVAAIEFALIITLLLTLLFGIIEFSRVTFYWNAATEATRLGARLAVVCDFDASVIKTRMANLFPVIPADNISIDYLPDGCAIDTCQQVKVKVAPAAVVTYIPFLKFTPKFPPFSTTLPRESMKSTFGGVANPVCM